MKTLKTIMLLAAIAITAPAFATSETTTETWTTTDGGGTINPGGGTGCATPINGAAQACSFSGATMAGAVVNTGNGTPISSSQLTAYAYSTATPALLNTTASVGGAWVQAQIAVYGNNGIGISNVKQTATNDTIVPQHAIDNSQIHDILVLDLGSAGWDTVSFSLGYICAINSTGDGCTSSSSPFTVQAWMGGSSLGSAYDFTQMCFSGCGSNNLLSGAQGFVDVGGSLTAPAGDSVAYSAGTNGGTVATFTGVDTTVTIGQSGSTPLGRYLIVTPGLSDSLSAFKFSGLVATKTVTTGTGVPVPGSLPLLALGLLALTLAGRRRFAPNA